MSFQITLLALLSVAACKSDGTLGKGKGEPSAKRAEVVAPSSPRSLLVYATRDQEDLGPALAEFERTVGKALAVSLEIKYVTSAQLTPTDRESPPADVLLVDDVRTLALLEPAGVLAPLPKKVLASVADAYRSSSQRWVGLAGRARVLAYNSKAIKLEEVPASATELIDPKWSGKVGLVPTSPSHDLAVGAMTQQDGIDAAKRWLEAMVANGARAYLTEELALAALTTGEIDLVLVDHVHVFSLRAERGQDVPVELRYLKTGKADSLVRIAGAGVVATSSKQDAAHKLIEFLLSESGQRLLVGNSYELPLANGARSPIGLPDAKSLSAPVLDYAKLPTLGP